jgi:hypothetical protein
MEKLEKQALLNVSARIDADDMEQEQVAARKVIREAAKAKRDELKKLNDLISKNCDAALAEGDARIAAQFLARRQQRANGDVLALAIAQQDSNNLVTV